MLELLMMFLFGACLACFMAMSSGEIVNSRVYFLSCLVYEGDQDRINKEESLIFWGVS